MSLADRELQQLSNEGYDDAADEIATLRAELAKVTWQRNAAMAKLAASEARAERLSAAALEVIEFNRQHARDQYGDADKCEHWSCVRTLRAALEGRLE